MFGSKDILAEFVPFHKEQNRAICVKLATKRCPTVCKSIQ